MKRRRESDRVAEDSDEAVTGGGSFAGQRRNHTHWYNPEVGKAEGVRAPSTDEQALGMLSGYPDSGRFVEGYVVLREEGLGVEQALVFVGHHLRMFDLRRFDLSRTPELQRFS